MSGANVLVARRIQEAGHIWVHALAAVGQPDYFEAVHIFVDLALANHQQLLIAEVDVGNAAAKQDGEGLGRLPAAG